MSKIKIFGLGGLDENGKNNYVVEVNNDLFVFDCGLKYASGNLYGIDYIIPDFDYLVKNRKRIKGVFITHGHYENMGSVSELVEAIPEIKIYATEFTRYLLTEEEGIQKENIVEVVPHHKIDFGENSIFPISVSHSSPDSVMYILNTSDGAICYTGDFIIDPTMKGAYDMDLGRIAYVGKQGVLAMMCESVFSEKPGHTSPNHRLTDFFKSVIQNNEKRIICLVLPTHLYTIQDIFNGAQNRHRKVITMGKKLHNIVNYAKEKNYLSFENDILGDLTNIDDENAIILISDDKKTPYSSINKIYNGYDKFIKLKNDDTIVFSEPRYDSSEKTLVKLENDLAMFGCNIVTIPKDKSVLHHASSEDLMLMMKLINPKYFIPVKGEYRYMVGSANLASEIGIPKENILLKQNGDIISIEDKELKENFDKIKINNVFIDGKSSDDVGELVIKDRELLSENGIVLVSATISKKDKILLVGPEITTRGFIYIKDSKDMIIEIKKICEKIIERNINPTYVDYTKIKTEIREELGRFLYNETECKPMIIAVVQEV